MNENLKRANKVTAYWEGNGVAVAIFYKTHDSVASVKSSDEVVAALGFVMPEDAEDRKFTAAQKLESFKTFVQANAASFGILYDPIDRRDDAFKFPGKYNTENVIEYASQMLSMALSKTLTSVQSNVVDKMVKAGTLPEGSAISVGTGNPELSITESYNNGNIKYATVKYPVAIAVGDKSITTSVSVDVVSGQIKKPRHIGDTVLTMSGVKTMLVDGGVLPKKPESESPAEDKAEEQAAE